MTVQESVAAILAGWAPMPTIPEFAKEVGGGWLVGGIHNGRAFVKHTGMAPDGPDTPDDPIEAAHWLVRHVAASDAPPPAEDPSPAAEGPDLVLPASSAAAGDGVDEVCERVSFDEVQEVAISEVNPDAGEDYVTVSGTASISDEGSALEAVQPQAEPSTHQASAPTETATAYPGVAVIRETDDLATVRAKVIDHVIAIKQIRIDALVDANTREDLMRAFMDYQNKGALGLAPSPQEEQGFRAYQDWIGRRNILNDHADALCRSARDADRPILILMDANLEKDWPT